MKTVILLGGSGYIGTHLAKQWLSVDSNVRIISLSRSGRPHKSMTSPADERRVEWIAADLFNVDSYISKLPEHADAIVDLVGTATAKSDEEFVRLNVGPVNIMVELMNRMHIQAGCYISGRMGMPFKNKPFIATKQEGEAIAKASGKDIGIIKPSLVYGDRPDAVLMVPFVKAMGLFNRELKPVRVEQLSNEIIQICSN
ncbi:NAD(P)-dependent oxidoreductase [Paenibacillus sp. HN-1]|uniref:NAD-dependent epimerase/dehydratase family protein n=1 Tax=Paenibacillus TaxID=44249 RepID=UPI001CA875E8|nr:MULTISPECIES: NAD(P)-dependent oxidoreductase [Paenibacillus]MBY9080669.1 NAD(P)-dependent oxidoreductase [Paenibacillus sp. CGMCC 1.18879]MBY9085386.1 NAD(P)-dependent oxidoreductase [Paenibacillus sinensis]